MMKQKKTSGGQHNVTANGADYVFELHTSRRKTLTLRVRADGRLTVDAPTGTPLPFIYDFVRSRARWIDKHQARLEAQNASQPERHYQHGEQWPYLGQFYPLHITTGASEGVTLTDGEMHVTVKTPARAKAVLRKWYAERAREFFSQRIKALLPLVATVGIPPPDKIAVREMISRWGSCSGRGRVALNLKLIQLSPALIDYVILHELCHLKELNHSPRYYALLDAVLPDWKTRRQTLRQTTIRFEA